LSRESSAPGGAGLRIGIDGTCLALTRGYGRFLRELMPPLLELDRRNEYVVFVDRHAARRIPPLAARVVEAPTSESQVDSASARGNRSVRDVWIMSRTVSREGLDVLYFPSVFSWFPVRTRARVAVAFHDTIAERHARVVFPTWRTRWFWKFKVELARRQAHGIITVSEWSKRSLADWFGIPAGRIFVTPEAPAALFRPAEDAGPRVRWLEARGIPGSARYLLYVGGFNPHKNLGKLLRAFADARQAAPGMDLRLVLVGDHAGDTFHSEVQALRAGIAAAALEERVHFAGFVPDEDLRHVYAGAVALVMPSLEEGFGLPAVEAAACGAPCVATKNSPLPEVLEGGGLFVDPESQEEITAAVRRLVGDPASRAGLAAKALERARALSWRVTAERTRDALETIAGRETA
jgi:glycosyltransferase involved in cell wall biosynthesis